MTECGNHGISRELLHASAPLADDLVGIAEVIDASQDELHRRMGEMKLQPLDNSSVEQL